MKNSDKKITLDDFPYQDIKAKLTSCAETETKDIFKFTFEGFVNDYPEKYVYTWIGRKDKFANKDFDDYRSFPNVMSFSRELEWTFRAQPISIQNLGRGGVFVELHNLHSLQPVEPEETE